jgi:peptidoglycan hydrolase-like protein with peptidoglycan-binding domain/UDP-2,3-diacylglucosamine pyrophosphatase LpxH
MAGSYTVQENEWLQKIASDNGFRSEQTLIDANPELQNACESNYAVLQPGTTLKIPSKEPRTESRSTGARHEFQVASERKDLVLTLQFEPGMAVKQGIWKLSFPNGEPGPKSGTIQNGNIRIESWLPEASDADLEIRLAYNDPTEPAYPDDNPEEERVQRQHTETIHLSIGGLDPLVGDEPARGRAVQKILTNLGFYGGPIDGDLTTDRARAALLKYQAQHNIEPGASRLVDDDTLNHLIEEQGGRIGNSGQCPKAEAKSFDRPLDFGDAKAVKQKTKGIANSSVYVDPQSRVQNQTHDFGAMRFFPDQVYVAVSDSGTTQNPNIIRMKTRRFLFVDTGMWLGPQARHFTVIWGRHVYLCQWHRDALASSLPAGDADRLDHIFFKAMGGQVEVETYGTASWALEHEFDWDKLVIVLPDLHLMTHRNGKIFSGPGFLLDPELDLLLFAKKLASVKKLEGSVTVIQLGDSFDLWVGCEPRLFQENNDLLVELIHDPHQRWTCRGSACKDNHDRPDARCAVGVWKCDYVDCEGMHRSPDELCDSVGPFSCGREEPHACLGHPRRGMACPSADDRPGSRWKCRKTIPPCPGHRSKHDPPCPDHIDPLGQIARWVHDIQGASDNWVEHVLEKLKPAGTVPADVDLDDDLSRVAGESCVNPAVAALRLIQKRFELILLHGNHDDYLIRHDVTQKAGLSARQRLWETDGVLIEHGHRMEARLIASGDRLAEHKVGGVPTNYDGAVSGYEATNTLYHQQETLQESAAKDRNWIDTAGDWAATKWADAKKPVANWFAGSLQQPQYISEVAQVWLGRYSLKTYLPPHIFVMGHTHMPMMADVLIDYFAWFKGY